jgi:hypothetical protein
VSSLVVSGNFQLVFWVLWKRSEKLRLVSSCLSIHIRTKEPILIKLDIMPHWHMLHSKVHQLSSEPSSVHVWIEGLPIILLLQDACNCCVQGHNIALVFITFLLWEPQIV